MNVGKYLVTAIACAISVNSIHKIVCGLLFFPTQISNAVDCCKIPDKFLKLSTTLLMEGSKNNTNLAE
jgi:hypothetical protein